MHRNVKPYYMENNQEAVHSRFKNTIAALNELMKDTAFIRHRKTLDEIAKAMSRAIENDQKWLTRCQKLQTEIAANEIKIKTAIRLSSEDKNVIDTLKEELQNAWRFIENLKVTNNETTGDLRSSKSSDNKIEMCKESKERGDEIDRKMLELSKNKYKLLDEIEKSRLQVFELEEELANKEKAIEEVNGILKLKTRCLDDIKKENEILKQQIKDPEKSIYTKEVENKVIPDSKTDTKPQSASNEIINSLKKKFQDLTRRDQLSLEKLKHFMKKNKMLSIQLQRSKNQNNLLKLQLTEQTKMLDLLSCQCCKLEDKDKKQARTITELENIRNKYVHMIGSLELEIHNAKKKAMENEFNI